MNRIGFNWKCSICNLAMTMVSFSILGWSIFFVFSLLFPIRLVFFVQQTPIIQTIMQCKWLNLWHEIEQKSTENSKWIIIVSSLFQARPVGNFATRNGFTSKNFVSFARWSESRTSISATRRRRRRLVSER